MSDVDFQALVDHVIRFRYAGGSSPQDFRTVTVKKVEQFAGKVLIGGLDRDQVEVGVRRGEGYRRYYSDKILGSIEVLS